MVHTINKRIKQIRGVCWLFILLFISSAAHAQLAGAEYYIDNDPGPGAGDQATAVDGAFDEHTEEVIINLDVSGLEDGQHIAFTRFQDASGRWGIPKGTVFTVKEQQIIQYEIVAAEYYIGNDPGEGNGNPLTVTEDGDFGDALERVTGDVDISGFGLSDGNYEIFVRFKDANGRWGAPRGMPFVVSNRADINYTIQAAEYFIDTDPGQGNGFPLNAADGAFDEKVEEVDMDITLTGLAEGQHTIFTRFQKSNGNWGAKKGFVFTVADGAEDDLTIAGAEYFVDTDPGPGLGTPLATPADGAFDEAVEELQASFDVTGLENGTHFAYFRVKGSNGKWGPARGVPFKVEDIVYITQAEYFFDSDPGQGSGTPISVPKDGNFDSIEEQVDLDVDLSQFGLSIGQHTLYFRFKNSKGEWSNPSSQRITIQTRPSIETSVDTLLFDDIVVGDSLTQTFTVSNNGDAALNITNITSSLPDFTITPTTGQIDANSSDELTFTVKYLPLSAGDKNAVLTIANNDANKTIRLLGGAIAREPIMTLSDTEVDFGTVLVGDSVSTQFAIYNTGYGVLNLATPTVSSSEFRVSVDGSSLAPGATLTDSIVVTVSLVPTTEGSKTASVTLGGNVANQQVSLTGNAELNPEPTIAFNTDSLGFNAVEIGSTKTLNLEIRNLGTNTLNVTTFTVSGTGFGGSLTTPSAVERGNPLSVPITFTPESASQFTGSIQIVSNDANKSTLSIPLSGEGTTGPPTKLLSVNPDSIDFGLVTVNQGSNKTLTLINSGNATLKITSIKSDNSSFFVEDGPTSSNPILIAAEQTADVAVTFSPSQGGNQSFSGMISISSDRTDSSDPLKLTVKGTGVDQPTPNIQLSTNQLNFGELKLGESTNRNFTLRNSGNADLNVSDIFVNGPDFTILTPSNKTFILQSGESQEVLVMFEPEDVRSYTNKLTIRSNIDEVSLDVFGSGVTLSTGVDSTQTREQNTVVQIGAGVGINISPTGLGDNGTVNLYYKAGGGGSVSSYTKTAMQKGSGSEYALTLPANLTSSGGISYWFEVSDGSNTVTSPETNPHLNPYTISVEIPDGIVRSAPQPAGTEQNFYRLISVPLVETEGSVSNILSNFGEAGPDKWRLFRWQSGNYVEHNETGFESFAPGRGYWFITNSVGAIKSGSGQSAPTDKKFSIFLQPGWNMIGSPFTYPTSWGNATVPASVDAIWGYDGSGFESASTLTPWEGYFVNNSGNNPVELLLSPIDVSAGSAKSAKEELPMAGESSWSVQLLTSSGVLRDDYNFAGVDDLASNGTDALDMTNAPNQPGEFLSLGFENESDTRRKLAIDARLPSQDGHSWDFEINTNSSNPEISIDAVIHGKIPEGFEVLIIDKDQESIWQVSPENSSRTIRSATGTEFTRKFRLIVGSPEFVEANDLGITDIPSVFELKNNYPNPFNPSTTMVFGLSERAHVTIEVYNTLGQRVATLINTEMEAGYHDFIWDASRMASGVYFYRMTAQGSESDARFMKLNKMTLIK